MELNGTGWKYNYIKKGGNSSNNSTQNFQNVFGSGSYGYETEKYNMKNGNQSNQAQGGMAILMKADAKAGN